MTGCSVVQIVDPVYILDIAFESEFLGVAILKPADRCLTKLEVSNKVSDDAKDDISACWRFESASYKTGPVQYLCLVRCTRPGMND